MSNTPPNAGSENSFVLKHRIVGAAFLLFFGALFLPWILGPPSEALKAEPGEPEAGNTEVSAAQIEDEILAALDQQEATPPEQVYISKITPLDKLPAADPDTQPVAQSQGNSTPVNGNLAADRKTTEVDKKASEKKAAKTPAQTPAPTPVKAPAKV